MRKFKVVHDLTKEYGLKIGDIVTLVEGSIDNDLYELPKHLHGTGHHGQIYDVHLHLKENNYVYLSILDVQEINNTENIIIAINTFTKLFPAYEITTIKLWDQTNYYVSYKVTGQKDKDVLTEVINIEKIKIEPETR